jgi:hypothetical protein
VMIASRKSGAIIHAVLLQVVEIWMPGASGRWSRPVVTSGCLQTAAWRTGLCVSARPGRPTLTDRQSQAATFSIFLSSLADDYFASSRSWSACSPCQVSRRER